MEAAAAIVIITIMSMRENEFEPKLGKPPADQAPKLKGVRAAVRQAARQARTSGAKPRQPSVRAHFTKGSKGRGRPAYSTTRRVVVKIRYATNAGGKAAPLRGHIAYLSRDQAERRQSPAFQDERASHEPTRSVDYLTRGGIADEASFAFYDRTSANVDSRAVTANWAEDPRHFRMIVSAEDGAALGNLKPFIRELMSGLENRLGVKLDWLAVDHFDTDNPHTHVLIRGRLPDGQDLFIPSKLISSGIREQAQEIVTRVLGPRLEADLAQERFNDISAKTVTPLDRELQSAGRAGPILPGRPDLAARLERLETWGLAERRFNGWRLTNGLTSKLRSMAEREDIERTVASVRTGMDPLPLLEAGRSGRVMGELVHVGPVDEFDGQLLAVIETGAGELRYARFALTRDLAILEGARAGAFVAFEANIPALRPSDEAVARVVAHTGGRYSADLHMTLQPSVDPRILEANARRLEVMRRAGLVERQADGVFIVSGDHLANALAFEERLVRRAPFSVQALSYWSLGEQIEALGPTQLDHVLAGGAPGPGGQGRVAQEFEVALQQRRLFLVEQGWMDQHQPRLPQKALQRLAALELSAQAKALSEELGVPVLAHTPNSLGGVYARRVDLAQGRQALIVGERQANLVPWRPALERFAGREVEGVMRGQGFSWRSTVALGRGISLPD